MTADGRELWCQHKQAGQAKRQQVAALGCDQQMQFIEITRLSVPNR